jgi:hypothetical protein
MRRYASAWDAGSAFVGTDEAEGQDHPGMSRDPEGLPGEVGLYVGLQERVIGIQITVRECGRCNYQHGSFFCELPRWPLPGTTDSLVRTGKPSWPTQSETMFTLLQTSRQARAIIPPNPGSGCRRLNIWWRYGLRSWPDNNKGCVVRGGRKSCWPLRRGKNAQPRCTEENRRELNPSCCSVAAGETY